MSSNEAQKQSFDLQLANFQSIGKAQKNFLIVLMSYLGMVWIYAFNTGTDVTIQLLGVGFHAAGFWQVEPAALTVLSLGLIGSINAMGPVWRRLRQTAKDLGLSSIFYDYDTQKNLVDYLTSLTLHPEKRLEGREPDRRFSFSHFLYPSILLATIYTTYFSIRRMPQTYTYKSYVLTCIVVQVLFSIRIFWKAACRFFGIRKETTGV